MTEELLDDIRTSGGLIKWLSTLSVDDVSFLAEWLSLEDSAVASRMEGHSISGKDLVQYLPGPLLKHDDISVDHLMLFRSTLVKFFMTAPLDVDGEVE